MYVLLDLLFLLFFFYSTVDMSKGCTIKNTRPYRIYNLTLFLGVVRLIGNKLYS
jgi:hypothetical protein